MMNESKVYQRIDEQKERLKTGINWFPLPAMISFVLVLLFIGHLLVNINPRLGNSAVILSMNSETEQEGSIWLSVSENEGQIYVSTFDRKVFSWAANTTNLNDLNDFREHLRKTSYEISAQAAVSKFISKSQTKVVLAVDQRLRYFHIRPIIHVLAKVGLDDYGFETKMLEMSQKNSNDKENKREAI